MAICSGSRLDLREHDVQVIGERHAAIASAYGKNERSPCSARYVKDRAGEQDGRRFARRARDLQDHAGQDAADRVGQHDRADRLPAAGAHVPAGLAERHAARWPAPPCVLVMITGSVMTASVQEAASTDSAHAGEQHERADAEQRVHDARHAGQVDHRQIHDPRQPVVAAYSLR